MAETTKKSSGAATAVPVRARSAAPVSRLQGDLERLLDDLRLGWPSWMRGRQLFDFDEFIQPPAIDVVDEKDHLVVKAEVPGMAKEDVTVEISDSTLIIRGEKKHEKEVKEANYYRSEREYGSVYRSIELPVEVSKDGVTASLKDGVLEVRMAKTAEAKRKAITVKVQ